MSLIFSIVAGLFIFCICISLLRAALEWMMTRPEKVYDPNYAPMWPLYAVGIFLVGSLAFWKIAEFFNI